MNVTRTKQKSGRDESRILYFELCPEISEFRGHNAGLLRTKKIEFLRTFFVFYERSFFHIYFVYAGLSPFYLGVDWRNPVIIVVISKYHLSTKHSVVKKKIPKIVF